TASCGRAIRPSATTTDSDTARSTPTSTSKTMTPSAATTARRASERLTPQRGRDGGAAGAGGDREPLQGTGGQVGHPQGEQLLVRVDAVPVPGGDRPGGQDVVGEPHEDDPEGHREQGRQVVQADQRQGGGGQPLGDRPDDRHGRAGPGQ